MRRRGANLDEVLRRPYVLPSAPRSGDTTAGVPQATSGTSQFGMTRFIRAAEGRADLQRTSEPEE
ncbi:hypothetical protein [Streptomyces sp. cg40]|uniref:hypothetical protein n=1 Tax=Streptomyces sp. cg40 TaxID=3419764 RepID=UPI003CFC2661